MHFGASLFLYLKYTYDNLGRLLKEQLTTGEVKEYNYDTVGNVTLFKLTKDGVQKFNTVYSYDKLDRVQSVTNGTNVSSYTYDRNGRLSASTTNGTTTTYGYNRAGWVTSLATQSGNSQLQSHSYQYYPDGNISQKQSTVGTLSEQVSYQYDDAGRLIREQIGNDITSFTYDNYSNRATMTSPNAVHNYTYDANNRLLKAVKTKNNTDEITNYIYDNNGNQIAWYKGSISPNSGTSSLALTDETDGTDYGYYTYDAFNRLSTYTNGVTNASYTYGADNLRKSKTVDGVTTNYVWNGSDMVLEEKGTQTNRYYYGADGIAFANLNGTTNYYQKNAHGDITALTNSSGTITKNYQFDAFGNELINNANDINPFRYAGEYIDNETGLIYLRNRYYDTNNGRFITEDPIKDGLNWYVYCGNNPINSIDIWGLAEVALRDFVEERGGSVEWNDDTKTATVSFGSAGTKKYRAGEEAYLKEQNNRPAKLYIEDSVIIEDFGIRDFLGRYSSDFVAYVSAVLFSQGGKNYQRLVVNFKEIEYKKVNYNSFNNYNGISGNIVTGFDIPKYILGVGKVTDSDIYYINGYFTQDIMDIFSQLSSFDDALFQAIGLSADILSFFTDNNTNIERTDMAIRFHNYTYYLNPNGWVLRDV